MDYESAALTTVDNPFDPFDDFEAWFVFDVSHGYNCCSKVARFAHCDESMTQREQAIEIENGIDRFLAVDFTKLYKKVKKYDDSPVLSD